jgi:hypothetical protein
MKIAAMVRNDKTIEAEFPGLEGFVVTLSYASRQLTRDITKSATVTKMTVNGPSNEFDNDKFIEAFCANVIKGWKGLTRAHLSKLLPIDEDGSPDELIDFDLENVTYLMKNSTLFDTWINKVVFDLDQFRNKE